MMGRPPKTASKYQFLPPKKVSFSMLTSTGPAGVEYPTITISYIGVPIDSTPDDNILADFQAFGVDYRQSDDDPKDSLITITAFGVPRKELLNFSDCYFLDIEAPTSMVNPIFIKMRDLGRYAVIVNTEWYTYKALVDNDTGEILEADVDYRMMN